MKRYCFDRTIDRTNTNSVKWDLLKTNFPKAAEGALPLWIADMDFPCAEPIIEALHRRVDLQIFGYSTEETGEYYDAVCGWYRRHFSWEIDPRSICYSPGIVPAIAFLLRLLTNEGDGVLIQRPVYYPFTGKITGHNRMVINNSLLYENGRYTVNFEDFERKIAKDTTKLFILCSPHNPVGRVWTEQELKRMVEICKKYNKWIISDEIHSDLVRTGVVHHPLEMLCPEYKHKIITCVAPSKTYNLAGLSLSNIIINNPALRERWREDVIGRFSMGHPNPFAITATIAAYTEGEDWLEQVKTYIDENFAFMKQYVDEYFPKTRFSISEGTYLAWIDLSDYISDKKELEVLLQTKAGVVLDEGYIFGDEGACFERINVACPRSILADCLSRIKTAFDGFEDSKLKPSTTYAANSVKEGA